MKIKFAGEKSDIFIISVRNIVGGYSDGALLPIGDNAKTKLQKQIIYK